jgi:amidase
MPSLSLNRRATAVALALLALLLYAAQPSHAAAPLDLANLSGAKAEKMLQSGTLTSVALTKAYIERINALNKSGPALNAVTQLNRQALQEAADSDALRAKGTDLGPAMGLPILLKDIIDAKGEYTSAGNWSLRDSFPAEDSGVVANLRAHGVVILGKVGLSEFANYFGGQASGFSNLTGQVLNANDADETPSGSSSGTGAAVQSSLSALGIGTETSGSIISPSREEGIVGLRPTIGLVPGYGIAPIIASQDTAGPMERTVTDAAMTLQSITGDDPAIRAKAAQEYKDVFGDDYIAQGIVPEPPATTPDYMSALDPHFVEGMRIGYTFATPSCPAADNAANTIAYCALQDAGATLVPVTQATLTPSYPGISNIEAHKTIDAYYANLGAAAPIHNMVEEVTDNNAHPILAEKYGNYQHWINEQTDDTGAALTGWRAGLATAKQALHANLDAIFTRGTPDPADDVAAVIGSVSNDPQGGYPQVTIPMGYTATARRAQGVSVFGRAYTERTLLGVGYVLEQKTKLRQNPQRLNPAMYRCADLDVAPPYAWRGGCNPDYDTASAAAGTTETPDLGFTLETASVADLQARMTAGTLTAVQLTKAYLNRIALVNAQGPGLQAVRALNAGALAEAQAADAARAGGTTGALLGIPVLLDDSYDVAGMTTSAGSIALQANQPAADSAVVAKLKAAGAVILGKTNVTELNSVLDANITQGYSSLGGQVLDAYDTDKTPGGSSAGSASALASGLAALTVGLQSSQNGLTAAGAADPTQVAADAVIPASVMGVDTLKPTVGRVSRVGVLGVAKAQDSPAPMARTITDLAGALNAVAGIDTTNDSEQVATGATPDYAAGLSASLTGHTIGVLPTTAVTGTYTVANTPGYNDAIAAITGAGGTATPQTISSAPADVPAYAPSVLSREFKRDLDAYLAAGHSGSAAGSLSDVFAYLRNHSTEGLKYASAATSATLTGSATCGTLAGPLPSALCTALDAPDVSTGTPATTYASDLAAGRTNTQSYVDGLLGGRDALLVPANSPLVGLADRAGYPVLEMQSGYQFTFTANTNFGQSGYAPTHNPYGVALIGTADSEATLLRDAYAIEQQLNTQTAQSIVQNTTEGNIVYTDAHVAPSVYNPAMYRCIQGSVYYSPYQCHPGEIGYVSPVAEPSEPTGTEEPPAPPAPPAPAPPAPPAAPAPPVDLTAFVTALQKQDLAKPLKTVVSAKTTKITVGDRFRGAGKVIYALELSLSPKPLVLAKVTKTIASARFTTVTFTLGKAAKAHLKRHPKTKLVLKTTFVSKATGKSVTTTRAYKRR